MTSPAQPQVTERAEQHYVGIRGRVTMDTIPIIADRFPELLDWLAQHQIEPAGPPMLKYNLFDGDGILEIEAAVPVTGAVDTASSDAVISGTVPAGRYASTVHLGHFEGLPAATGRLLDWTSEQQLRFEVADTPTGERWAGRLEIYHTDPRLEPDPSNWTTELAFLLKPAT
ncbi:MAG: GyrI-like domain-containing protein [Jatrophihabitantaceae bacterium]